ncbi:hypothetical protein JCM10212_005361 [Sporobolomyces blumeae]
MRLPIRLATLVPIVLVLAFARAQQIAPSSTQRQLASTSLRTTTRVNATQVLGGLQSVASAFSTALPSANRTLVTASPAATASASSTKQPGPPTLDTRIDATFGVLGALLIFSGLAIGTVGAYYRRTALFVSGSYAGTLVVGVLIVHFALVGRQSAPRSTTRGLFLLASLVAGLVSGAFCFLFRRGGELVQASLAGLVLGCGLLATRTDCLIQPIGLRYILLLGLAALGFVAASVPRAAFVASLVATSALGATALVLGIDCFTTAGLKEFYLYNLGFSTLFPKLDGHYYLSNPITIELGVLLAAFVCMMAFQQRFYVLFNRRQQSDQDVARERTVRESKVEERARRRSTLELGEWEEKYGHGERRAASENNSDATSSDEGKRRWFGLGGKSRKSKAATASDSLVPTMSKVSKTSGLTPASVDFLPRLDVEFADVSQTSLNSATVTRSTERPALSVIQPVNPPRQSEEWDDYISTRQVAIAIPGATVAAPARSRSSLALVSPPSSLTKSSPRFADEDADDDVPLALSPRRPTSVFSGATRTQSSPQIGSSARLATMSDLALVPSLPEPSANAAPLPRSHSRALSLAQRVPAVLLESPSKPTLPTSESRPGTLNEAGRRATLIDLTEPSKFDSWNGHERSRTRTRTASEDRIVIGDRRKSMAGIGSPKEKAKPAREGPKIMDFEDLDAKHRKRLSMLQTTAADTLATEAAKAKFKAEQQAEATAQRRKDNERRRSLSTNNLLASPRSGTDEFGMLGAGGGHGGGSGGAGRPTSIASLGGLLGLKRTHSTGDVFSEQEPFTASLPGHSPVASPVRPSTTRRQSGPSLRATSTRTSTQAPLAPPHRDTRRHSLTTLLETSFDEASVHLVERESARPARPTRRMSGGLDKVVEWRNRSSSQADLVNAGHVAIDDAPPAPQPHQSRSTPTTPMAVEPARSTSTAKKGSSKKSSWLDY